MGCTSKNNVMVDCLISANRIRTRPVERVFRAVDRGDYVTPDDRYQAHLQQPWRSGKLHLSAPCIYGEVLEGLELKPGQSFLNVGSGTGYFSTVVGLIIGCSGVNHGVEVFSYVVDYANQRLEQFIESSPALDEFDFCAPKFYCGNGLCLGSVQQPYDRVYCGADCPAEFLPYFKQLIKIGGVVVLPCGNRLLQIKRKCVDTWTTKSLLNVSFATLQLPTSEETAKRFTFGVTMCVQYDTCHIPGLWHINVTKHPVDDNTQYRACFCLFKPCYRTVTLKTLRLKEMTCPQRLQILSYAVVRKCMRAAQMSRRPRVFEPLLRCPRLTDVDVNELLRYILSMDRSRENPLPLSGFPSEKRENVCYKDGDHIKSLVSSSKSLEGTNKSDLTLKNDADASRDKSKSPNITQANKELNKANGVQANKCASPPLFQYLQKPTSDSLKETNKSGLTSKNQSGTILEANKELEQINRGLSNTFLAIPGYPDFRLHTSKLTLEGTNKSDLTSKNDADASRDKNKSPNITQANKELNKANGVQANKCASLPLFEYLQKPTSDSQKETNKSGLTSKIQSGTILEANKELEQINRGLSNTFLAIPGYPDFRLHTSKLTLEGTNKSDLTSKNDADASRDKNKSPNITQANKELNKANGVQANKCASLPLFEYLQKPTSDSQKETNKSGLTSKIQSGTILEANKELEQINRGLSNTFLAIPGYPDFRLHTSKLTLEGTNKSDLTSKNDADASRDKNKSPNITQANKELNKANGVQANKCASLPLFEYLQKPTSDSQKETNKSGLTSNIQSGTILEANKELEQINRELSNTFPAILGYPNFQLHTSKLTLEGTNKSDLTSKNAEDASVDKNKSVNITETKEHLEKIKGIMPNQFPPLFGNLQTTNDSLKETNNSGLTTSNDPDESKKSVNITETNKDLEKKVEEVTNIFFSETLEEKQKDESSFSASSNKGSEKKKKVHAYNFAPSKNSQLPSLKFSVSGITANNSPEKVIKSGLTPQTADASDTKNQSDENVTSQAEKWSENINSSPVFIFSDSENDSFSCSGPSPLKTVSGTRGTLAEACSNKPPNKSIKESVKQSISASPERVTEPNPANELNSKCDQVGKDIRLSILMNQGVMEVHLPYEQKESTNIIFTKMNDKPMITSEDKSSRHPHNGEPSETHLAKSQDTYKSDILARIQNALSSIPLSKVVPPVTVPISFKTLNFYTEWIWDSMMIAMAQSFDKLDHEHNKAIFQKGALLLAEAKVTYAQRTISQTPNEELRSRKAFTDEELLNLKEMASKVPLPLAVYLECLGNTNNGEQVITPILAEHPENMALSGAPHLMLPLFQLLRFGVPLNGPIHQLVLGLGLPMLHWEEFPNTICGAKEQSLMVRITKESHNFWITTRNGSPAIKWDVEDSRTFKRIVLSLDSKKGHNVDFDLSHGMGSQAQLVQTIDYNVDRSTRWFTKVDVDDYSIKLGAAFAFHCPNDDQCTNRFPPRYMSGIITPRRIMFAILCSVYHS